MSKDKNPIVTTKVIKSENGHTVRFSIDHQSFCLSEKIAEEGMTSYQYAKWYKDRLDEALSKLI